MVALERIRLRRDFAAFAQPTKRLRSGPLRISYVAGSHPAAVAFAIGKPVGNAVVRNRVRRQLRALLTAEAATLPQGNYLIKCGFGTETLTYDELRHHLQRALSGLT